jgi:hypothetical protein
MLRKVPNMMDVNGLKDTINEINGRKNVNSFCRGDGLAEVVTTTQVRCEELVPKFEKPKRTKCSKPAEPKKGTTAAYITNLPLDTTVDELEFTISKYGGVIVEDFKIGEQLIEVFGTTTVM